MFVLLAAHMTELAPSTAPVLLVLLRRPLGRVETEPVEGLAAHLAVEHLSTEHRAAVKVDRCYIHPLGEILASRCSPIQSTDNKWTN